jgi:hypothetical protein
MGSLHSMTVQYPPLLGHSSVRSIATHVGVPSPISVKRLEDYLSPAINRSSGGLEAQTVKARAVATLHASGLWMFNGHAHENGLVGNNYAIGFVIDFRDDQGNVPGALHEKSLSGTVAIGGSRDDDFVVTGFDQRIADHWDQIKTARVLFHLHAATDPAQVLELLGESLVALVAVGGAVLGLVKLGVLIAGLGLSLAISGHVNSDGDKEGMVEVDGQF